MNKNTNYLDEYKKNKILFEEAKTKGIKSLGSNFLEKFANSQGQDKFYGLFIARILDQLNINLDDYQRFNIVEIGCGSGWAMSFKQLRLNMQVQINILILVII